MSMDYYVAFRRSPGLSSFKNPDPQYGTVAGEATMDASKWAEFVEKNKQILTWFDDTSVGRLIQQDPQHASKDRLGRKTAYGEYDKKHDHYRFILDLYEYYIQVSFDGMRPNKKCLLLCLELATHMGAKLFKLGREVKEQSIVDM